MNKKRTKNKKSSKPSSKVQPCPLCGSAISAVAGSIDSKCRNCGYKDACCGS